MCSLDIKKGIQISGGLIILVILLSNPNVIPITGMFVHATDSSFQSTQFPVFTYPLIYASPHESNFGGLSSVLFESKSQTLHFITTITEGGAETAQLFLLYGYTSVNSGKITIGGKFPIVSVADIGTLFVKDKSVILIWPQYRGEAFEVNQLTWVDNDVAIESLGILNSSQYMGSLSSTKNIDAILYDDVVLILSISKARTKVDNEYGLGIWNLNTNKGVVLPFNGTIVDYWWDSLGKRLLIAVTNTTYFTIYNYKLFYNSDGSLTAVLEKNDVISLPHPTSGSESAKIQISGVLENNKTLFFVLTETTIRMLEYDFNTHSFTHNTTILQDVLDFKVVVFNNSYILIGYTKFSGKSTSTSPIYLYYRLLEVSAAEISNEEFIDRKRTLSYFESWSFNLWANSGTIFISYLASTPKSEARFHQIAFGEARGVYVASNMELKFSPYYHHVIRLFIFIIPAWLLSILVFGTILLISFAIYTKKKKSKLSSK